MSKPYVVETWNPRFRHLSGKPIAFFSAEYAIEENLPIYVGGLGILAGDFLLEASEQGLPIVAVGPFYRRGFEIFEQSFPRDNPWFDPLSFGFELLEDTNQKPLFIDIELNDRTVSVQVWFKPYGTVHLFLLDTYIERNLSKDREITAYLYPSDFQTRLLQEVVFGIGGIKLLRRLQIKPSLHHLNEGHAGFAALALAVEYLHNHPEEKGLVRALEANKSQIVATKHTILPGSGIFFTRNDFRGILDTYLKRHNISFEDFCSLGRWEENPEVFSMTKFLFQSVVRANAVSRLHATFERKMHPKSMLFPITNAVYLKRWQSEELAGRNLAEFDDEELWKCHERQRQKLVEFINNRVGVKLNPYTLTVVWARRLVAYKQPLILFSNRQRLAKLLADRSRPVQFLISGKPHVADQEGIGFMRQIIAETKRSEFQGKVVYLPDYSLSIAKYLVAGADIWLNTPQRGKEASGTSGMKSAVNGGLQFSTADGWVEEVDWTGRGWVLPETNLPENLYDILEKDIIPLFYERDASDLPGKWIRMMRISLATVAKEYSTKRMFGEYLEKLYFPKL